MSRPIEPYTIDIGRKTVDAITYALVKNGRVNISNFAILELIEKKENKPKGKMAYFGQKPLVMPAHKRIVARFSKEVRDRINKRRK